MWCGEVGQSPPLRDVLLHGLLDKELDQGATHEDHEEHEADTRKGIPLHLFHLLEGFDDVHDRPDDRDDHDDPDDDRDVELCVIIHCQLLLDDLHPQLGMLFPTMTMTTVRPMIVTRASRLYANLFDTTTP